MTKEREADMALFETKRDGDNKTKVFGVRMSEREIFVLKRYAKKHKLKPSNFVRKAIKILIRDTDTKPGDSK